MIERADKIVVSEHSDHWDLATKSGDKPIYPDLFYRGVALSEQQKGHFAGIVAKLDPKTQDMFAACIFEAHHTIRFFEQETLLSTMDVCFQCGEVEWNGSAATPPWSLYGGLARFIKDIGLEPERDWRALAMTETGTPL